MSQANKQSRATPILAAGGIVLGAGANSGKIVIVRRHRYGNEVALPKGKLQRGEGEVEAALREVGEETGCTVRLREFAGTTHYLARGVPKMVFYFIMETDDEDTAPMDSTEIDAIEWMAPRDAVDALSHREDRELVAAVFAIAGMRG